MLPKHEKLVITFHTTTDAMAMEQLCRGCGAPGRIIPVPAAITADCGLAWCAGVEEEAELTLLMARHHLRHQGIWRCLL